MSHFSTGNLPAIGLGHRDPRRPHVTGGIGGGIPVFVTEVLKQRIYVDSGRTLVVKDRVLLERVRALIAAERTYSGASERFSSRIERIYFDADRQLSVMSRTTKGSPDGRSLRIVDRTLD